MYYIESDCRPGFSILQVLALTKERLSLRPLAYRRIGLAKALVN